MQDNFEIVLERSRMLTLFLLLLYLATAFICIWVITPILLNFIILVILLFQARNTISDHGKRTSKQAIVRVWQDSKGQWGCQTRGGHCAKGILKKDSYKSLWLTILRFRLHSSLNTRSISVIIPFDAVSSSEYRVLCARLKTQENT